MTFSQLLSEAWQRNNSLVCVGLDPEPTRFPAALRDDPDAIFAFCRAIVDATADRVCCFKPQIAHFAANGAEDALRRLIAHIHEQHPGVPVILDAKRGDIGSTAQNYATEAFDRYGADAVTVNPYLGRDSVQPFLDRADKGVIILCRTSNPGPRDVLSGTRRRAQPRRRFAAAGTRRWSTRWRCRGGRAQRQDRTREWTHDQLVACDSVRERRRGFRGCRARRRDRAARRDQPLPQRAFVEAALAT